MGTANSQDSRTEAPAAPSGARVPAKDSSERTTRIVLGLAVAGILGCVSLLTRPQFSQAADADSTPSSLGAGRAARLAPTHVPAFTLESPSTRFFDAAGLAGHSGIPAPPVQDEDGRANLGIIMGPALFVWVYGGSDGVRYSVADLQGHVLASGLTASQVYGAFPEVNIPEMEFGPDGKMCEPLMWAGGNGFE